MTGNLTREEAEIRAALIEVLSYDVVLDLSESTTCFTCHTTVQFRCTQPGTGTFVDLIAAEVQRIVLNGVEIPPDAHDSMNRPDSTRRVGGAE